jgi:hypothetical protein
MPDFSSPRIEGISEREQDRDLPDLPEKLQKPKTKPKRAAPPPQLPELGNEETEEHDLDEMA